MSSAHFDTTGLVAPCPHCGQKNRTPYALPALGARMGVQSIPTMAVFRGGKEVARTLGARPAPAIAAFVRQALGE